MVINCTICIDLLTSIRIQRLFGVYFLEFPSHVALFTSVIQPAYHPHSWNWFPSQHIASQFLVVRLEIDHFWQQPDVHNNKLGVKYSHCDWSTRFLHLIDRKCSICHFVFYTQDTHKVQIQLLYRSLYGHNHDVAFPCNGLQFFQEHLERLVLSCFKHLLKMVILSK